MALIEGLTGTLKQLVAYSRNTAPKSIGPVKAVAQLLFQQQGKAVGLRKSTKFRHLIDLT